MVYFDLRSFFIYPGNKDTKSNLIYMKRNKKSEERIHILTGVYIIISLYLGECWEKIKNKKNK